MGVVFEFSSYDVYKIALEHDIVRPFEGQDSMLACICETVLIKKIKYVFRSEIYK